MKALFSTLGLFVFGCCVSWAAVAPVLPATVVGSYQALLYTGEDNTGTPAGLVTLTPTATGKATGKVTTAENKTYSFTTTFNYVLDSNEGDSLVATSTSTAISIARPKMTPLGLALTIEDHGASVVLKVVLSETGAANRISNSGFRNVKFATGVKASWMGKYTAALEAAEAPVAGEPQGSGYATGIVAATGTMTFAGKTGDGVSFTASLAAGPNMNYVAYLNPYKTAGSFLAGKFTLVARTPTGVHAVAAESPLVDFQWQKAPKATDKAYPVGFGPVGLLLTMEPWDALLKNQTLEQALGVNGTDIFDIAFSSNFNTTTYATKTPVSLGLDAKNALYVAAGGAGSPSALIQANWTKFFTIKVNPATGVITGSLTITDTPFVMPPARPKTITRKLTIEGVMLRLPTIGAEAFASGFMTIPPLDPKTGTTVTAAFTFNGPFKADALAEGMSKIAGNYQAIFDVIIASPAGVPNTAPTGVPADDATVNFSVSADLKTLTFNGRKIPLQGDGRPLNLVYFSSASPAVTVTLTMNLVTGELQKCDATYIKLFGFKGAQMISVLSRNNPQQTIVKLP